jgi:hypothetical protein
VELNREANFWKKGEYFNLGIIKDLFKRRQKAPIINKLEPIKFLKNLLVIKGYC